MVPGTPPTNEPVPGDRSPENEPNIVVNAIIGGIAGIVLSFVPMSPILGGGLAGYLQGGETKDGLTVGATAGLVMLVPFVFIGMIVVVLFLGMRGGQVIGFGFLAFFLLMVAAMYTVVLGALGGLVGTYLKREL